MAMNLTELKQEIQTFKDLVIDYRKLRLASRDALANTVTNHELIADARAQLTQTYARLEEPIKKIGNRPRLSDGVNRGLYSPYINAFTADVLQRVGKSIDAVIDDLNYISGKLSAKEDADIQKMLHPTEAADSKPVHSHATDRESKPEPNGTGSRNNKWNYVNPVWLIWQVLRLMWRFKIISFVLTIIGGLVVAYVSHQFGWV